MNRLKLMNVCKELAQKNVWCIPEATLWAALDYPDKASFRVALTRHVKAGVISRYASKLYKNPFATEPLFAAYRLANFLRPADTFYLSLESLLSEASWISQIPSCLTFVTTGRSYVFNTDLMPIHFVHTEEDPSSWGEHLKYMPERQVWVATPEKALEDLKRYGRNLDLVLPEHERE